MLLDGPGTDIELTGNFFVTAALDQQIQNLLVSRRNLYGFQINHDDYLLLKELNRLCD